MTTSITVHANCGKAVAVIPMTTGRDCTIGSATVVAVGHDQTFYVHSGQSLMIEEIQPDVANGGPEPILRFFGYDHLLHELQMVSAPFGLLAHRVVATLPPGPERSVCLRKLLEAKDCAVRAAMEGKR